MERGVGGRGRKLIPTPAGKRAWMEVKCVRVDTSHREGTLGWKDNSEKMRACVNLFLEAGRFSKEVSLYA